MIRRSIILLGAICVISFSFSFKLINHKNSAYKLLQTMPTPTCFPQLVAVKGKFYIFSQGNSEYFRNSINLKTPSSSLDTSVNLFEFTPNTGIVKKISTAPFTLSYFGATSCNGKLYIAGGLDSKGFTTNSLFEFDITSKNWSRRKNMLKTRCYLALESISDKIYAISGDQKGSIESYLPGQDKWILLNINIPQDKNTQINQISASVAIENKVYFFYGLNHFAIFSPENNSIIEGPKPPFQAKYFDAVASNKKIYIGSGVTKTGIDNNVYLFNTVNDQWDIAGKIIVPRCASGLATFSSMLLYLGGSVSHIDTIATLSDNIYIYRPLK